jgi:uncharacterized protein with HEPN domain
MLDAAREAISFARGRTREDLTSDRMLLLSIVKEIEIIGEAAGRISAELKQAFPRLPWAIAAGMRHRLVHAYFDIEADVVWSTVQTDLPALAVNLEEILESEDDRRAAIWQNEVDESSRDAG